MMNDKAFTRTVIGDELEVAVFEAYVDFETISYDGIATEISYFTKINVKIFKETELIEEYSRKVEQGKHYSNFTKIAFDEYDKFFERLSARNILIIRSA